MKTLVLALMACALSAPAQQPKPLVTHEVNADRSITFRYDAPQAKSVAVSTDAMLKPLPLVKGDDGVWSASTPPLAPEIYSYTFVVDGVSMLDPRNAQVVPNLVALSDNVTVHGDTPQPWEMQPIPHGTVSEHTYTTKIAEHLPDSQESYVVYTPPGYDARRKGGYPVLYLQHGWSDKENGWTAVGRAQWMLDSFIDSGKAVPMIVVMPLGYGDFDFVQHGASVWGDPAQVDHNEELFGKMLLGEVIPTVEHEYNVATGRDNRAIAGLSMGGLESLYTGLRHPDEFAWVVGMSSAIHNRHFAEHLPELDAKKANLKLLWVACGTDDSLYKPNTEFVAWAKEKGLPVTAVWTPGAHTWLVWRDDLLHFVPLLFRK